MELFWYDGNNLRRKKAAIKSPLGSIPGDIRNGYRRVNVNGEKYFEHRLIWKLVFNHDPDEIDHINGNRSDNKLENLRSVPSIENRHNMCLSKKNRTGVVGVGLTSYGKWVAHIKVNYTRIHLGSFTNKSDAVDARLSAEKEFNFHSNHGRKNETLS